ncbi:MAG: helix-turn-helix transcriptional regulator, partial [Actinoplanes sp.]
VKAGARTYESALAEGLNLDVDAGIDFALGDPANEQPCPAPERTGWAPLTVANARSAVLVADGLTNPQIDDRLVIGRRTANTHVEHILTKLDFTSRAPIAAWATARQQPTGNGQLPGSARRSGRAGGSNTPSSPSTD